VINFVYDNSSSLEYFQGRANLASTNETVNRFYSEILKKLPCITMTYSSIDTVIAPDQATTYPPEHLATVDISSIPQHKLELKEGATIILMRNLSVQNGHCNGTRYIILKLSERLITAQRLNSTNPHDLLLIPTVSAIPREYYIEMKRFHWRMMP